MEMPSAEQWLLGLIVPTAGAGLSLARIAARNKSRQASQDYDRLENFKSTASAYFGQPHRPDVNLLWHAQRALVHHFVDKGLSARQALFKVTSPAILTFSRENSEFLDKFEYGYGQYLRKCLDPYSSRDLNRVLWPLVELLEELTKFFKVTPNDRHDSPLRRIASLIVNATGHDENWDGVWALSRGAQEIKLRHRRFDKDVDPQLRTLAESKGLLKIYNFCLDGEDFECADGYADFIRHFDNLPNFADKEALREKFELGNRDYLRRISTKTRVEELDELLDSFKGFVNDLIHYCKDINSQWSTVSFFRIALQRISERAGKERLDELAHHILAAEPTANWPMFPFAEMFEPVFYSLVARKSGGKSGKIYFDDTSGFVELLQKQIKKGFTQRNLSSLECLYGAATCLAELVEGHTIRRKATALTLLKGLCETIPSDFVDETNLLLGWFECRVIIYPRYVKTQFS